MMTTVKPGWRRCWKASAVFLAMPAVTMERLRAWGWRFYTFIGGGARFMFAWDAETARVDALVADLRALAAEAA